MGSEFKVQGVGFRVATAEVLLSGKVAPLNSAHCTLYPKPDSPKTRNPRVLSLSLKHRSFSLTLSPKSLSHSLTVSLSHSLSSPPNALSQDGKRAQGDGESEAWADVGDAVPDPEALRDEVQGDLAQYRVTSLTRNSTPSKDHYRALGIFLL